MKSRVLPSQAYEIKLTPRPAPFSLLNFTGHDALGQMYCYERKLTGPTSTLLGAK